MANPIKFIDMANREALERARLRARAEDLKRRGFKTEAEIVERLAKSPHVDTLYRAVQLELRRTKQDVGNVHEGLLPSQTGKAPDPDLTDDEKTLVAVYGILRRDGQVVPTLDEILVPEDASGTPAVVQGRTARTPYESDMDDALQALARAVAEARGEYNANFKLYDGVLAKLVEDGDREVDAGQLAGVVQALVEQGVPYDDRHLRLKVDIAVANSEGAGGDGGPPSSIDIDPPDLEAQSDVEVIADNLKAMQVIYLSSALEDVFMFKVVENLAGNFQQGLLPFGRGRAGDLLYSLWRKSVTRMNEVERRNLYARGFGFPGGDTQVPPNRDFADLWMRFLSAVSSFNRQATVNTLLTSTVPFAVNQELVRKAGRDLAANLSLHGYGVAYFAATELQQTIGDMIEILSDPEVRSAYGARDMWQVIDQVATLELGGARNSIRYRTMAQSGQVIIRWLANHARQLAAAGKVRILDVDAIRAGTPRLPGTKPTTQPTDGDLVDACEQWLAVTGTQDAQIEQYAQPTEGPAMTSRPIQIPQVAQDLLASAGIAVPAANGSH